MQDGKGVALNGVYGDVIADTQFGDVYVEEIGQVFRQF